MRIVGIDPGALGAFTVLEVDKTNGQIKLIETEAFPLISIGRKRAVNGREFKQDRTRINGALLAERIRSFAVDKAYIEDVHSMPFQSGQFQFGFNVGLVHGILHSLNIPVQAVSPQAWKSIYPLHPIRTRERDKGAASLNVKQATKNAARRVASQLFHENRDSFKLIKDDGKAESALLAVYALYKFHPTIRIPLPEDAPKPKNKYELHMNKINNSVAVWIPSKATLARED